MPYTTADIRNLALVGQAGAGKTLLAEALLAQSGAIRAKGSLARGTTVCDFDPQEKALLHSLDAAICGFESQGKRVNIVDTPGYPDFLGRSLSALEAVETAAIVVSAINGVEPMTRRMMEFAKARGLCRLIVINKIDSREARTAEVLAEIREAFGRDCLPLNLPADGGSTVVDCFFQPHGRATDFSSVDAAHTEIIDQVVEVDEELMALYLEQGEELSPEQLHDPFEQALREDLEFIVGGETKIAGDGAGGLPAMRRDVCRPDVDRRSKEGSGPTRIRLPAPKRSHAAGLLPAV